MFETLLGFFAFGAIGFWLLLLVASIIFIASVECDTYSPAVIATIILAVIYWKPLIGLGLTWQSLLIGTAVYVGAGIAWSVWRWIKYVKETVESYNEKKGGKLDDYTKSSIKDAVSVSRNKSKITAWIAYWPWSAFWNITGDFFKMIYENMKAVYQKIANKELEKLGIK